MKFLFNTKVHHNQFQSLLFNLNSIEQNMPIFKKAIENPMRNPHRRTENDGDVLQGHLVETLPFDHVTHVDEDPLEENSVTVG